MKSHVQRADARQYPDFDTGLLADKEIALRIKSSDISFGCGACPIWMCARREADTFAR